MMVVGAPVRAFFVAACLPYLGSAGQGIGYWVCGSDKADVNGHYLPIPFQGGFLDVWIGPSSGMMFFIPGTPNNLWVLSAEDIHTVVSTSSVPPVSGWNSTSGQPTVHPDTAWSSCPPPKGPWPVFLSAAALQADPWGDYYKIVYGSIPEAGSYPLDVGHNWLLHNDALIDAKLLAKVPVATTCPSKPQDRYDENNVYQPPSVSWIWHAYPFSPIAASTWAEVTHEQDPFGDETRGMWLQYAPGSGVWFNTGVTISFVEHQEAYTRFKISAGKDPNSAMCAAAAGAGYDSVQFTGHVDHVSYACDTAHTGRVGFDYMGLEIAAVKLVGTFTCGTSSGAPPVIRKGWHASDACVCGNSKQFLNCQGVPKASGRVGDSAAFVV